jgi:hypothetical protein
VEEANSYENRLVILDRAVRVEVVFSGIMRAAGQQAPCRKGARGQKPRFINRFRRR